MTGIGKTGESILGTAWPVLSTLKIKSFCADGPNWLNVAELTGW